VKECPVSDEARSTERVAVATAQATHPPGVLLDYQGNPVLDARGEPLTVEDA
jgi:hypothetical protein